MTFASHFAVVTTLSGVWGIPMVAHFFNISPAAAGAPLLAFMIGNAIGSIFLGHAADRAAAALDSALIRICVLRMILIAMLLPPLAHAFGLIYVTLVFTTLGLVAGGTVPLVLKCTKTPLHRRPHRRRRIGEHDGGGNLRRRGAARDRFRHGRRQPARPEPMPCRVRRRSGTPVTAR